MAKEYRSSINRGITETRWTILTFFLKGILPAIVIIGMVSWGISVLSKQAQVLDEVMQPQNIIQNYEWFELTYNDALALDRQIKGAKLQIGAFEESAGDRSDWDRVDKTEHARLNAILQGLRQQRDSVIADYNARSNLLTRSIFKGTNLPYQLSIIEDQISEEWIK